MKSTGQLDEEYLGDDFEKVNEINMTVKNLVREEKQQIGRFHIPLRRRKRLCFSRLESLWLIPDECG